MLLHLEEEVDVRRNVRPHTPRGLQLPHLRQAFRRRDLVPRFDGRYPDVHRVVPPRPPTLDDVAVCWREDARRQPKPRQIQHRRMVQVHRPALAVHRRRVCAASPVDRSGPAHATRASAARTAEEWRRVMRAVDITGASYKGCRGSCTESASSAGCRTGGRRRRLAECAGSPSLGRPPECHPGVQSSARSPIE